MTTRTRSFGLTQEGVEIVLPVYGDITPLEELAVLELNQEYLSEDGRTTGERAVEYRAAQACVVLNSRLEGQTFTVEGVNRTFFRRQLQAICDFLADEIRGATSGGDPDAPEGENPDPKPLENTGNQLTGRSRRSSRATAGLATGGSGDSPAA